MRVLHVIGPMEAGGAQTQLLNLLRAAHRSRWEATVCETAPGPLTAKFTAEGIPVVSLDRSRHPISRVRQIRRLVDAESFHIVHSNLWNPNVYARLAVAGFGRRPGVVISERNVEAERRQWQQLLDRFLAPWTDVWVGNSEAVCTFIRAAHPVKRRSVVHIPNAVDTSIFNAGVRGVHEVLRVGSIGRLAPEKGFEVLTDAIRSLIAEGEHLEVEIVGVGPLLEDLRNRAEGLPIRYIGSMEPGQQVAEFLRSLDVFVLPSTFREGRANVVLEALACQVPTVVTDIPGMHETVGDAAVIVPPNDVERLAEGILEATRNGQHKVRRHSPRTVDDLVDDYAALFDSVSSRPRRPKLV